MPKIRKKRGTNDEKTEKDTFPVFSNALFLIPSTYAANSTYTYPANGGNLKFDPTTGQITKCDSSVYEANIPEEIYGVPVTGISYSAFGYQARKLIKVTIPSSITEIGKGPFYQSYIQEVTIPDSVTSIGEIAFGSSRLKSVIIPDSVKTISKSAFSSCKNLKTVVLSSELTKLERWIFSNCSALENISLPNNLEEIGYEAFSGCKSLSSLTLGSKVSYIDDGAFKSCSSLKKIYFQGDAPMVGKNIFGSSGIDGLIIYYPEGASGWSTPTWNGVITKSYKLNDNSTSTTPSNPDPVTPTEPEKPAEVKTANPTNDKLVVNGVEQSPTVYKIGGSNYFQIRDVAAVLNGTEKQFAVGYSGGKVTATSGQPYDATGKELKGAPSSAKDASPSNDAIVIDGVETSLTVYKIGGSNYFKLRDLGKALDFNVGYSGGQVTIDTSKSYS